MSEATEPKAPVTLESLASKIELLDRKIDLLVGHAYYGTNPDTSRMIICKALGIPYAAPDVAPAPSKPKAKP